MFEIGDLMLIELALISYFKDIDISLSVAQHIQGTIAKIELQIQQINAAAKTQGSIRPTPPTPPVVNP